MQLILQGSVRQFPLPQLLAFFAQHAHSGTLDVEAKPKRARICLRDGGVMWAEAAGQSDVESIVLDACLWQSGTFTMHDEVALPEGAIAHDLDLAKLLDEAARRLEIAKKYPDGLILRVVEDSPQDQLSLTPDELRLLIRIGMGKTFGELAVGRDRSQLAKALTQLEENGLVKRSEGAAPSAPEPAPRSVEKPKPAPAPPPPAPEPEPTIVQPVRAIGRATKAAPAAAVAPPPPPPPAPEPEPAPTEPQPKPRTAGNQLIASLTTDRGAAFALVEDEQTIGRDASNAIAVPDGSISVRHARITRTPQGFFIEDVGSRNGTFVNSEKVTQKRLLADNDLIRLGKVIFTFNLAAEMRPGETTSGGSPRPQ